MLDNLVEFASYWWFRYLMVSYNHKSMRIEEAMLGIGI